MRFLRQWRDYDREGVPRSQSEGRRGGDPAGHVQRVMPMSCAHANGARDQSLCERGESMSRLSRRDFLKTSGALIVSFSFAPESMFAQRLDGASSNQLDGWLAVNADGSIT